MSELHERVGQMLISKGLINETQLHEALAQQKEKPYLRLGEVLLGLGYVQLGDLSDSLEMQHRALRLGQILMRKGDLDAEQLDAALKRQSETGKLLGELLVDMGFCTRTQVHEALEYQQRHPFYQFAGSAALPGPSPQG